MYRAKGSRNYRRFATVHETRSGEAKAKVRWSREECLTFKMSCYCLTCAEIHYLYRRLSAKAMMEWLTEAVVDMPQIGRLHAHLSIQTKQSSESTESDEHPIQMTSIINIKIMNKRREISLVAWQPATNKRFVIGLDGYKYRPVHSQNQSHFRLQQ